MIYEDQIPGVDGFLADMACGAPGGPSPLLRLDFSRPTTQTFPTERGDALWLFEAESGNVPDELGSNDLEVTTSGWGYRKKTRVNIHATEKLGIEVHAGTARLAVANGALGSLDGSQVRAFECAFRSNFSVFAAAGIMSRGSVTGLAGWNLYVTSAGTARILIYDTTGANVTTAVSANHNDGGAHVARVIIDEVAEMVYLVTDLGAASVSYAALASVTNADARFAIAHESSRQSSRVHTQFLWACYHADGSALSTANVDDIWNRAQDPTGALTTYTRAGVISDAVGEDDDGIAIDSFTNDTVASGWKAGFGYGLRSNDTITNHIPYSIPGATNWGTSLGTGGGPTTENNADAPNGLRQATTFDTGTGANPNHIIQVPGLTELTTYTFSVYVRSPSESPGNHTMHVRNDTGTIIRASGIFALTDQWQRNSVSYTTQAGETELQLRIYSNEFGGSNAPMTHLWGAQLNAGSVALPYVATVGSAATSPATRALLSASPSQYLRGLRASLRAVLIPETLAPSWQYILDGRPSSGTADRRILALNGTGVRLALYDASSANTNIDLLGAVTAGVSFVALARWDFGDPVDDTGNHADIRVGASVEAGSISPITVGADALAQLGIGSLSSTGVSPVIGLIQRLETFAEAID
jgi:hypothetical protein